MGNEKRTDDKIVDLVQEYAQRALDVLTSDDVLKLIPGVKTFVVGAAAVRTVRDEMLLTKLETFMTAFSDVPAEQRQAMIDRLASDATYRRKLGEHIIEVLDRLESHRKPKIAGEIFAAFARGEIDLTLLQRLLNAIERLPAVEIDTVRRFVDTQSDSTERARIDRESIQALIGAGLVATGISSPIGGGSVFYYANTTCQKFVELNLDVKST